MYQENRATQNPFLAQTALFELFFAFQAEEIQVVLVLNHFEQFAQLSTPQTLNTLRGLRDSFKETICFIVGMAQEATYLSNPDSLDFMYPLLTRQVCWIGAMNETDARWVITRRTQTASTPQKPYSDENTKRWLSWLAANMIRHNQVEFLIERMQRSWFLLLIK